MKRFFPPGGTLVAMLIIAEFPDMTVAPGSPEDDDFSVFDFM